MSAKEVTLLNLTEEVLDTTSAHFHMQRTTIEVTLCVAAITYPANLPKPVIYEGGQLSMTKSCVTFGITYNLKHL